MDARKSLIRYAPKAQDTSSVLPEMVAFKDPSSLTQAIFQVWDLRL